MQRYGFVLAAAALAAMGATGCATKKYVRNQMAPVVDHAGQLDQQTAKNHRAIQDVDSRAQSGIQQAQGAADTASQNAQSATSAAGSANTAANDAVHRADSLASVVGNLDNYKQTGDVTVNFGFDKSVLTKEARGQLDSFAAQLGSAQNYILEVTGGTDSTGPAQYNYQLSQRRADAVVQYLASKYNISARRFYLIGIGKDDEVASNKTADGRLKNRRVEVQLLTNVGESQAATASNGAPSAQ